MNAAVKGLVEFTRRHAATITRDGVTICCDCRATVEQCEELGTCDGDIARAALAAFEKREPLRNNPERWSPDPGHPAFAAGWFMYYASKAADGLIACGFWVGPSPHNYQWAYDAREPPKEEETER